MIIHFNPKNKIEKKEKPKLTLNKVFYMKKDKQSNTRDKAKISKSKDFKKKKK